MVLQQLHDFIAWPIAKSCCSLSSYSYLYLNICNLCTIFVILLTRALIRYPSRKYEKKNILPLLYLFYRLLSYIFHLSDFKWHWQIHYQCILICSNQYIYVHIIKHITLFNVSHSGKNKIINKQPNFSLN